MGPFELEAAGGAHVLAEVGEHEAPAPETAAVGPELAVVGVVGRGRFHRAALAQEQVGARAHIDETVGPRRIAREQHRTAARAEAVAERERLGLVRHLESLDLDTGQAHAGTIDQLYEVHRTGCRRDHVLAVKSGAQLDHPPGRRRRSGNDERPVTPRHVGVLEKQEGQAAEMVAVQVRDQHYVRCRRVDAVPLHGGQNARPALEQEATAFVIEKVGAVLGPRRIEGVAGAQNAERGHAASLRDVAVNHNGPLDRALDLEPPFPFARPMTTVAGQSFDVRIDALSYGRSAVARRDGRVMLVESAAPGDLARVELTAEHARYDEARLLEVLERGSSRTDPPCPIVASCGGCPWQHLSYPDQLLWKQQAVVDSLERIAGMAEPPVEEAIGSPETYEYRNRIKLRFHEGELGFYRARSHSLVRVESCLIAEPAISRALPAVERFVAGLATAITRVEILARGQARGLILALNSKGRLRAADSARVKEFLASTDCPAAGVVMWGKGWSRRWGRTTRRLVVDEASTATEIDAGSFSQVNTGANRILVAKVIEAVRPEQGPAVLDLFAGAGNFALPLARRGARVTAVESDRRAVEFARQSAREQDIAGIKFLNSRVEDLVSDGHRAEIGAADLIVADPPRSGFGRVAAGIASLGSPKIVYVSCDPATLARDVKLLAASGYRLAKVVPVDLFPHSFHIESVCTLELT